MVSLSDIQAARTAIARHIVRTPLLPSRALSVAAGVELLLKLECRQHTGSFKPRGALNKIRTLSVDERAHGVVAASAGNHALGVAHACEAFGLDQADLFVQGNAAPAKIAKLRRYAVRLHLVGTTFEEAQQAALAHARATGATLVSAYDDPAVIAGQGTVGLEIAEDAGPVDAVVVPVGGGALLAGIAVAIHALHPKARLVGVNPEASPSALLSWRRGAAIDPYDHEETLAHGLAGGLGKIPFAVARDLVDEIVLVSEVEMKHAMAALIDAEQVLAEASGIAAVAALLYGKIVGLEAKRVVAVVSGGNIDAATLKAIL